MAERKNNNHTKPGGQASSPSLSFSFCRLSFSTLPRSSFFSFLSLSFDPKRFYLIVFIVFAITSSQIILFLPVILPSVLPPHLSSFLHPFCSSHLLFCFFLYMRSLWFYTMLCCPTELLCNLPDIPARTPNNI